MHSLVPRGDKIYLQRLVSSPHRDPCGRGSIPYVAPPQCARCEIRLRFLLAGNGAELVMLLEWAGHTIHRMR